jgi:hypothetical protein
MANKITLEFEVTDKGTLKQVTSDTNKLSKVVKDSSHATDQASNSKNRYSKLEKGSAQLTSNTTKSFAKQAQTIGSGLVPAYATLAANIFAVSAAFGALKRAAGLEQLEAGLIAVGSAAGQNLPYIADQLREITGAAISTQSAMESVALGTSAGFSTTQMEELTRVAKGASLALGRDMEDAMSRLVRGAAKLEPEILDELGIMVRLDDVTRAYAENLGKTTDSLTNFERRMAFTNAIIDQGTDKFGQIAEKIDPNPYNQLAARFRDLTKSSLELVNTGLGPFLDLIANNTSALIGVIGIFGTSVASKMLPALYETADAATKSAENFRDLSKEQLKQIKITSNLPKGFRELSDSIQSGTITLEEQRKAITSLNKSLAGMTNATDPEKLEQVTEARKKLTESIIAHDIANVKDTQSASLAAVARGEFKEALNLQRLAMDGYSTAMHRNMKVQGTFGKALAKTKIAVFNLTSSFKLLGTAVLRFLPYIGLAITAFGALQAVWSKLFGKSDIEKQVDEIVKSFDSFSEINDTLDDTIANIELMSSSMTESKRNAELYTASLKAQAGVYGQIADGIEKVLDLEKKKEMEVIKSLREDLRELESDLTSEEVAKLQAGGEAAQRVMDANNKMFGRNKATEYYFALQNIEEKMNDLGEASRNTAASIADNLLENAIINIESNKTISEAMQEELRLYKQYQDVLREFANDPEIVQEVKKAIDDMAGSTKQAIVELEGLSETSRKFNIEFTKLLEADEKPFENVLGSLVQISSALNNASSDSDRLKAVWEELPADIIEVLGTTPDLQGLESYISKWEQASTDIANAERNAKKFKDEAKDLEGLLDLDPSLVDDYYKALDRSVQAQITALEKYKEQIEDQAGAKDKILEIDREIADLATRLSSAAERDIASLEARISRTQILKKLSSDIVKNTQDRLAAELSLKEEQLRMTAGADGEVTAKEELEISKKLKQDKIDAAEKEAQIRRNTIESEYTLAEMEFEILKQRFALADKEMPENFAAKYESLLQEGKSSALAAIDAEQELALKAIDSGIQDKINEYKSVIEELTESIGDLEFDFDIPDLSSALEGLGDHSDTAKGVLNIVEALQQIPKAHEAEIEALDAIKEKRAEVLKNTIDGSKEQTRLLASLKEKETQIEKDAAKSKIAMYGQTVSAVGGMLSSMAEAQDQTSREGFELTKKMQLASTVVNTAGAIMNALATVPFPQSLVMAAAAAATGAAQIAQISSTEFGDSGEVSASTGSMSAGFSVGGKSVQSTVLGSDDFSESYAKTDELLKEIHAKEYYQLRAISDGIDNLNSGVKGLNLSLVRDIPEWGESQRGSTLSEYYSEAGMGSGWYTYGAHVTSEDITLQDVLAGKPIPLNLETTARQTKSSSIRDYEFDLIEGAGEAYSEQTANIQRLWENMYTEVASSTTDLAMMFGKSADEINALTMKGIGVEIISGATDNGHSSTWVSPEDLEKHLQQAYSTMGDMLIEDILGDWLKDYQQLEEGLAETGFRVASTNVVIQEFLDYLDYGFKDLAQEVEVSMDLADQAGGLKDFQEAAETFSESFTSEAHRFARSSFQLEKIFEGYNLTLPKTRDAFVDLMGTFDLTTEKGRDTFTSLLTSTEKLDEYYAYLEKVSDKQFEFEAESVRILQGEYASLVLEREKELETLRELNPALVAQQEQVWALQELEKRRDLELEILYLSGDGVNAIAEERKRELEALAPSVRAVQEQVWALEDLQGYQDQQIEILNLLGKEEQATAMERKEALGQLTEVGKQLQMQIYNIEDYIDRTETLANAEDQLAEARDNSTKSIDDLINKLLGSDKSPVQSMEYYESTYSELQDAIANARTPQELTDAVDSFTRFSENYLDYMAAYGGNYRDAFDSTMGILKEAKETASMFSDSVDGSRYFYVENVLTDILGESPSSDQILKWAYSDLEGNTLVSAIVNSLEGGDLRRASTQSYLESMFGSDIYENYKNSLGINLPGYATGGYHTGGWRLVGEQGPELEYTGSSRIYSNSDSTKMIADAIAEALSANNGGGSNMEVKVYLGTREMKDYHVEWHRTDHETHKAVRQEVR